MQLRAWRIGPALASAGALLAACNALVESPESFVLAPAAGCDGGDCGVDAGAPDAAPEAAPAGPDPRAPWPMLGGGPGHASRTTVRASTLSGKLARWIIKPGVAPGAGPAVDGEGTAYFVTAPGSLFAVTLEGQIRWSRPLGGSSRATPALSENGAVYVTARGVGLMAWSREGDALWTVPVGGESSPVIGRDGTVYVVDDAVHAVSPAGQIAWSYPIGAAASPGAAVAVGDDGVVYAAGDGLHAVSPAGARLWRSADGDALSPPPVVADGTAYVGSASSLVALDAVTGKRRWSWDLAPSRLRASPAVDPDGVVYFGDGPSLHAVNSGDGIGILPTAAVALERPFTALVDGRRAAYAATYADGALEFGVVAAFRLGADLGYSWTLDFEQEPIGFAVHSDGTLFFATTTRDGKTGEVAAIEP